MNFDLTEDQRRTRQAARDFAARVLAPRAADVDREGRLDLEAITQLGQAGWLGVTIPEMQGGWDLGCLALTIEEFSAACANMAAFVGANVIVARALLAYGNEEQNSRLLSVVAHGITRIASATVDPDNLGAGVLDARQDADGSYELRGETSTVTLFGKPDRVLVFARTAKDELTAFLVPCSAKDLVITALPPPLGKRAAHLGTFRFDGVRIPETAVLGRAGDGLTIARSMLAEERIVAAAEAIGIAQAAYEKAVLHVKEALPKSTDPGLLGVQVMLADMYVEIDAAQLLLLRAASHVDEGAYSDAKRSMAKLFALEMATRVVHKAMQIVGVRQVLTTPSLERHFRDARMTELSDDGLEIQRANIARTMLKA